MTATASITFCPCCQVDYGTRAGLMTHVCLGLGKGRRS